MIKTIWGDLNHLVPNEEDWKSHNNMESMLTPLGTGKGSRINAGDLSYKLFVMANNTEKLQQAVEYLKEECDKHDGLAF
jgi:hypothetical protein